MDTARAQRLGAALAAKVKEAVDVDAIDAVVAPAMGGLIIGYEVARQLGKPSLFCERLEGAFTFRRGFSFKHGDRVLVVEDVVTTGLSSKEAFAAIEEQGGAVMAECALIDRSNGKADLGVPFIPLMALEVPTYKPNELPDDLAALPAIKPGSRGLKT
jgi:orotate phosphoribosyltransferase